MSTETQPRAECGLCPRHCRLAPGQRGVCRVRWNESGVVRPVDPNRICALGVDPIEKKPFFHLVPGTPILSVACAGCTLRCEFCQNAEISQPSSDRTGGGDLPPALLAEEMLRRECEWVAYTYTEPFAWFEYTRAACAAVRNAGGRNVLVTAAYAEEGPVRELLPWITAANVDLKALDEHFYRDSCGGSLGPVLRALEQFRAAEIHLEITNLLIPGMNDRDEEITALVNWVSNRLGSWTPLHFSRFVPRHEMLDRPPTPLDTLRRARKLALDSGMKYVYVGNAEIPGASDTRCPKCGMMLVRRSGYTVLSRKVTATGQCPHCATWIPGVWS